MATKSAARTYRLENGTSVSLSKLSKMGKDRQIEVMRTWFLEHYSDPLILPYDSAEGGYQWIWGGPFDPHEELTEQFSGVVKETALEELSDELTEQNWQWSANPDMLPHDGDDEFDIGSFNLTPYEILVMSLDEIESAVKTSMGVNEKFLYRLLYANVITVLETYLADRFRFEIKGKANLIQRFIETDPDLKNHKISLSAATITANNLEKLVSDRLSNVIWHRLDIVNPMYKDTLNVKFPKSLKPLFLAVRQRHDIVHRNGKNNEGKMGSWDKAAILELVAQVRKLAKQIETSLNKKANLAPEEHAITP